MPAGNTVPVRVTDVYVFTCSMSVFEAKLSENTPTGFSKYREGTYPEGTYVCVHMYTHACVCMPLWSCMNMCALARWLLGPSSQAYY